MDSVALYYDTQLYPSIKEQKNFEKNVFNKTHKADNEIAFLEGMTIVYKSSIDLFFYVVGSAQENELMLMAVLNCLFESLNQILRKNVEKRCLLENLDGAFLVVDEIVDGGVILESDPQQVVEKVNYRIFPQNLNLNFLFQADDNPLSEHSVAQYMISCVKSGAFRTEAPALTEKRSVHASAIFLPVSCQKRKAPGSLADRAHRPREAHGAKGPLR
ncbi:Coatomer subunit zeta-1 [Bagarius yarrelli]|uniref:Coatomer subunit zeta n=1 Tax=Bagarius yarrelli TaxID=175774 RepID=A0A556TUY8_BAGYA|nr:Coatomer subunit zeta-1 [Bagarius yarrelli]